MTAPTVLGEEDDLARVAGHDYRRDGARLVHLAACACWRSKKSRRSSAPVDLCRYCRTDHDEAGTCRWSRWLSSFGGRRG